MHNASATGFEDSRADRKGCTQVPGHDGGTALHFANDPCVPARDYVRLSALPATQDFSLNMWIRTVANACNGWCTSELLPMEDFYDRAQMTPEQLTRGGVLSANIPFDSASRPGFSVAMLQPRAYLTVTFMPEGAAAPVQITGVREMCDARWHLLTITCARQGMLRVYVDGQVRGEADISALSGLPLPGGALTVGADADGMHGLGEATLEQFIIEARELSAQEILHAYLVGAVRALRSEIVSRGLTDSPLYPQEDVAMLLKKADECAAQAETASDPAVLLGALRSDYEALLLNTVKPDLSLLLLSDCHCEGDDGGRTAAVRTALEWARELGVDAVIDGGDYSHFGKDFELDSYWHVMESSWKEKPLFVTVGNHETLHHTCRELVEYHCGQLHNHGMVPEGYDKFFYDGEVNGYHFIVLAQYSDTYTVTGYKRMWRHAADIKPEQIAFLRERLSACSDQGKPVFLVIHNAVESLLNEQTGGRYLDDSAILGGKELYEALENHPGAVLCTGHVHHGFGAGAGFHALNERYNVIDMPGIRGSAFGFGINDKAPAGTHHGAYFVFVYGKTLVLRAIDIGAREFLTAYDQTVTLPI